MLNNLTTTQNTSFFVRCDVSGHPKPRITWRKNGKKVTKILGSVRATRDCKSRINGIYRLSNEDKDHANVLVICDADYKKDLGQYSCTAHNKLGNDTAKAFINILGEYFFLLILLLLNILHNERIYVQIKEH